MSSFRYMRLLVFFDLPRLTDKQRKAAGKFRKDLIESGFLMLQESVYCRLALNNIVLDSIKEHVRKCKPKEGNVMMLCLTEKQFENMEIVLGDKDNLTINSTNRMVIL